MKVTQANLKAAKQQYMNAKEAYYNHKKSIMTDAEFDALEDGIRAVDPKWPELGKTGVRTNKHKQEIKLARFMPSLNKMYPQDVSRYYSSRAVLSNTRWLIMDKLDGTSLQVVYKTTGALYSKSARWAVPHKLMTRGDGTLGKDVSQLLPFLIEHGKLPARLDMSICPKPLIEVVLRIEGVMPQSVFDSRWSKLVAGDKVGFENARQAANGVFNRAKPSPALADVDLVVLGVYDMEMADGLAQASEWEFSIVRYVGVKGSESADALTKRLEKRRATSNYEMDGLVICPARMPLVYENADKPKGIIAFKVNDEAAAHEAEVKHVIYQVSSHGRIIPKIEIKPVRIGGVTVKHATVHNAQWMMDRMIGPGARIKILRSGDVIPKVIEVTKKAKALQLPEVAYTMKGVHMVVKDKTNASTQSKRLLKFFQAMKIEGVAISTCEKLHALGIEPRHIVKMGALATNKSKHLAAVVKFQEAGVAGANAVKIVDQLAQTFGKPLDLRQFMIASHCFDAGVGERKLKALQDAGVKLETLLVMKRNAAALKIAKVKGMGVKTGELIADGLEAYYEWQKPIAKYLAFAAPKIVKKATGVLSGVNVSWTGYRDKEQEATVEKLGGTVVSFGSKTNVLLYREGGKKSSKIEKAKMALTWEQFCKIYKVN